MSKKQIELYGIVGLGRFGFALAKKLSEAGKEVLVVDANEDTIRKATAFTDHAFTAGALTKDVLQEIGIQNCDTVVVCIGERIDTCILTTLNVISLGVKHVIAKAISFEQGCVLEKLGAEVVYPERDMAIRLANRLVASKVMEHISLSETTDITEMKLTKKVKGVSVLELDLRKHFGLNIIAIKHNGDIIIEILPSLTLDENDIIVVVGKTANIKRFESYLGE